MENYQSNSHKTKKIDNDKPKRKINKVINGTVVTKKKPTSHKIAENFISEDVNNVSSYLLFDVLIPAIKDTAYDMLTSGLAMLLGRESVGTSRKSITGRTSYEKYSNSNYRNSKKYGYDNKHINNYNVDDFIFGMRAEAEQVLDALLEIVDDFGMVSISDLKESVGIQTIPSDNKYGWFDLGGASVERTREGYLLKLPKPTLLD